MGQVPEDLHAFRVDVEGRLSGGGRSLVILVLPALVVRA